MTHSALDTALESQLKDIVNIIEKLTGGDDSGPLFRKGYQNARISQLDSDYIRTKQALESDNVVEKMRVSSENKRKNKFLP